MKDEDKTKVELIKELKTLRKKEGESELNDFVEYKQNDLAFGNSSSIIKIGLSNEVKVIRE